MALQKEGTIVQQDRNSNQMTKSGAKKFMAEDFDHWLEDGSDGRSYSHFHSNLSMIVFDDDGSYVEWSPKGFSEYDPGLPPPELCLDECIPNIASGEDHEDIRPAAELLFADGSVWVNWENAGAYTAGWHVPHCDCFNVNGLKGSCAVYGAIQHGGANGRPPKQTQRFCVKTQPPFLVYDRIVGGTYAVGEKEDMEDWCAELNRRPTQGVSEKEYRAWLAKTRGQAKRLAKKADAKKR